MVKASSVYAYDSSKKLMWTLILIWVFTPEFGTSIRARAQSLDLVLGHKMVLGYSENQCLTTTLYCAGALATVGIKCDHYLYY